MNEKQKKFESYLDEQIAACKKRSELLVEDGRKDEGNFEKVRANVYEIFKTVLSVAEKLCGKDDLAKKKFFLQRLEQIPMSWTASYDKSKTNGDVEKMHIETIKLDTIEEIKNMFMQIEEEAI
ncbi:MAG: hypothetical protein K2K48_05835 [Anaeroplasmataceae bacterium]|nr:hypothetical protein [Anaeroplasmataceae bacterium]MDE6414916.1 hypothetical protein [Anaeroplasmataceae bacterium]